MKKMTLIFIMIWALTFTFPSKAKSFSEPPKPKLDCNQMVSELIKAIEDRDYKKICILIGEECTEKNEKIFNNWVFELSYDESLVNYLDRLRLFPEIGELPEWITYAEFQIRYLEGNREIELELEFVLKNDTWIIDDYARLASRRTLDEDKIKFRSDKISPPPPEGERTLDAGLTEIVKKFVSDFKEKNWESIKQLSPIYASSYNWSKLKKKGEKFGELLSQFPSIGTIPAPAYTVDVRLDGRVEGSEVNISVDFKWVDQTLNIGPRLEY